MRRYNFLSGPLQFNLETMTIQALTSNWKTTASGVLTVTLSTTAALLTYPPVAAHTKLVLFLGGFQVVGKVWISILQKDAKE